MRRLHAGTAMRLRARTDRHGIVLTDAQGDLTAGDLADHVDLLSRRSRRGTDAPRLGDLPPDAPLRSVLAAALSAGGSLDMLSSGTTGEPRLHRRGPLTPAQLRTLTSLARRIGLRRGVKIASAAPGVHGHGLLLALGALSIGAHLVDLTHLPSARRVELLHSTTPDLLSGVPVHLADLLQADVIVAGNRPLRISRVISGSDVLSDELRADLTRRWSARVHDVYGTTETGSLTVDGRPLRGVRIRERGGELWARTPFTRGREILTDRGRIDPRTGLVEVHGRADGLVSSGGMLHDPRAVARLLVAQEGIDAVTLRTVPDERMGRRTVAEVTLAADARSGFTEDGLRALVRDQLGAASVPREVVFGGQGSGPDSDPLSSPPR